MANEAAAVHVIGGSSAICRFLSLAGGEPAKCSYIDTWDLAMVKIRAMAKNVFIVKLFL